MRLPARRVGEALTLPIIQPAASLCHGLGCAAPRARTRGATTRGRRGRGAGPRLASVCLVRLNALLV